MKMNKLLVFIKYMFILMFRDVWHGPLVKSAEIDERLKFKWFKSIETGSFLIETKFLEESSEEELSKYYRIMSKEFEAANRIYKQLDDRIRRWKLTIMLLAPVVCIFTYSGREKLVWEFVLLVLVQLLITWSILIFLLMEDIEEHAAEVKAALLRVDGRCAKEMQAVYRLEVRDGAEKLKKDWAVEGKERIVTAL